VLTLPRQKTGAEGTLQHESSTAAVYNQPAIDEYLRKRLMPVEGTIPHLPGIEMYGDSIPAGTVGGDLFEYINFHQRYDIDARIQRAVKLAKEFLEPLRADEPPRNSVDDHVEWLQSRPGFRSEMETEYRAARSSEQVRVAEDLQELYTTAGVLLADAQGHGIISAKIASTPELFEKLNLRLAQSVTARNALGRSEDESGREIATMLYGELRPNGHFRFVNFGHPPPLVFSAEYRKFVEIDKSRMVQFSALGLQIPDDHPDHTRYFSLHSRQRATSSDVAEITLMSPGDILFLYTDGVYDGSDAQDRAKLEAVMRECCLLSAKDICSALLEVAVRKDDDLLQTGEEDQIDDKTVFIIKKD
jgi:serine phosphatase RsbU (regulator of sigma subunit)